MYAASPQSNPDRELCSRLVGALAATASAGTVLTFTAGVYHNPKHGQTAMGRKEYRKADLAPDQFFFQAAGDELAAFVGQHRAAFNWLLSSLDDDLRVAT